MFALIDCNNFFASCETVFNPKLRRKALGILSNNDGCIIARSKEAKDLGIKMGEPAFHFKKWIETGKLTVLSSNFTLYGDMSHRVMQTIASFDLPMEIYSIDEAFLTLDGLKESSLPTFGKEIRRRILQWTGIPVSIGIGKSKTLAKVAASIAKKDPEGVKAIIDEKERVNILQNISAQEVWGIGKRMGKRLSTHRIYTAYDLTLSPNHLIQKILTIQGVRVSLELQGEKVFTLEEDNSPKQTILCSRSFNRAVTSKKAIEEAVTAFVSRAAEKLRDQKTRASAISVFLSTSRFEAPFYANQATTTLSCPTCYTPSLISAAKKGLETIFRKGLSYKKAGVMLLDLTSINEYQQDFFTEDSAYPEKEALMKVVDTINQRYDKQALFFLGTGKPKDFMNKREHISAHYTTKWDDILSVR